MAGNEQNSHAQNEGAQASREERIARIAELNDECRQGRADHTMCLTSGILALGSHAADTIIQKVRNFDDFGADNDPYGERDFGAFEYGLRRVFWKIDYYDERLEQGSPDPADPRATKRVITVMLASEY